MKTKSKRKVAIFPLFLFLFFLFLLLLLCPRGQSHLKIISVFNFDSLSTWSISPWIGVSINPLLTGQFWKSSDLIFTCQNRNYMSKCKDLSISTCQSQTCQILDSFFLLEVPALSGLIGERERRDQSFRESRFQVSSFRFQGWREIRVGE